MDLNRLLFSDTLHGGVANSNVPGREVPSLLNLSDDYTRDEVIAILQNGRTPPLDNTKGPMPPLYMPAWQRALSQEDINCVADYLWSKAAKEEGRSLVAFAGILLMAGQDPPPTGEPHRRPSPHQQP